MYTEKEWFDIQEKQRLIQEMSKMPRDSDEWFALIDQYYLEAVPHMMFDTLRFLTQEVVKLEAVYAKWKALGVMSIPGSLRYDFVDLTEVT